jgi:UDP-glucose 4-epimerase
MKTVVIAGAAGLLGAQIGELLQGEVEVHAIVRRKPSNASNKISYYEVDLASPTALQNAGLPRKVDCVYHLAQSRKLREFPNEAADIYGINIHSVERLLAYAKDANAANFVLASTGGLYSSSETPMTEDSQITIADGDLRSYFTSKRCAELIAADYSRYFSVTVVRPFFIYGPTQADTMLIKRIYNNILEKIPVAITPDGGTRINPIYVEDAAKAVIACSNLRAPFSLYNIAGPEVVNIKTIVETLSAFLGLEPAYHITDGQASSIVADTQAMQASLWAPKVGVADGLGKMIRKLLEARA